MSEVLDVLLKRKKRIKPSDLKNVLDKKTEQSGYHTYFFLHSFHFHVDFLNVKLPLGWKPDYI